MITLYDIDSPINGRSWSPSTIKARYSLAFKGVEFTTVYVPFADVESTSLKLGAKPTGILPSGKPWYTFPVIQDSTTGAVVSNSFEIAAYLDKTYPNKPLLFPGGTIGLQYHFAAHVDKVLSDLNRFALPHTHVRFTEGEAKQADAFRARWEPVVGATLEEFYPSPGEIAEKAWENAEKGFNEIETVIQKNGEGSKFILGKNISFVDFVIAGRLFWVQAAFGKEGDIWKRIKSLNGGRWAETFEEVNGKYGKL